MDTQTIATRIAHLRNATYRDAQEYMTHQHPELTQVPESGRIYYHGERASMWIDSTDPTVVVAVLHGSTNVDIYRTTLSEFYAHSSYEPTGRCIA